MAEVVLDRVALVIGGGLSGLTFALNSHIPVMLFEEHARLGGLCRSDTVDGTAIDFGPHILFTKSEQSALAFLTGLTPVRTLERRNRVLFRGRHLNYPLENSLGVLPANERLPILYDMLSTHGNSRAADSMEQLFASTFGTHFTEAYLRPYNEKMWGTNLGDLATDIIARLPQPSREQLELAIAGGVSTGYQHQAYFEYPHSGGIGSVIESLAARVVSDGRVRVNCGERVEKVVAKGLGDVRVITDRGHSEPGSVVVSTAPIQRLLQMLHPRPPTQILKAASMLEPVCASVVVVKVQRHALGDSFATFVPQRDVVFHRVSRLGALYGQEADADFILAEVAGGVSRAEHAGAALEERVVRDLVALRLIEAGDIDGVWKRTESHAYPLQRRGWREARDCIRSYLLTRGIELLGRSGAHDYVNMDQAVAGAIELAESSVGA